MISNKLTRSGLIISEIAIIALARVSTASAAAAPCTDGGIGTNPAAGANCAAPSGVSQTLSVTGLFKSVSNTLIFIVGAISVIVLIIGGIRYVVSAGNATHVQGAKNTILYAIIGLVISLAAYAIVSFVFTQLGA